MPKHYKFPEEWDRQRLLEVMDDPELKEQYAVEVDEDGNEVEPNS